MSDAPRSRALVTTLWCAAGLGLAALLWDGAPDTPEPLQSRIDTDPSAQTWPPHIEGYVLRERHGPFP